MAWLTRWKGLFGNLVRTYSRYMRLAYRWAHLVIRRLDLGQRHLKGGVRYNSLPFLLALALLLTGCATPKMLVIAVFPRPHCLIPLSL